MELKINEPKLLEFKTHIEGTDVDDLKAKVVVTIDGVDYGFLSEVDGSKIKAEIPPLNGFVREENLRGVKKASARLDVIAGNKTYFTPWSDNLTLEIPVEVKAEMTEIKSFLKEADRVIKVKLEKTSKTKTEGKTKDEGKKIDEDLNLSQGSKKRIKSKFTAMLEAEKCPEGEKW